MEALPGPREQIGDVVKALRVFQPQCCASIANRPKLTLSLQPAGHFRASKIRMLGVDLGWTRPQRAHLVGRQPVQKTGTDATRAMAFDCGVKLFHCARAITSGGERTSPKLQRVGFRPGQMISTMNRTRRFEMPIGDVVV